MPDGSGTGTLGIRVPDSPFVLQLLRALGRPIIASSANRQGENPPRAAEEADVFGNDVDILADGGKIADGIPSTVVLATKNDCRILREGGISADDIESAWNG